MQRETNQKKIPCRQCKEQLCAYVSDALDESSAAKVKTHLQSCSSCQKEYQELQELLGVLHAMPVPPLSETFSAALHSRLCDAAEEIKLKKKESFGQRVRDWASNLSAKQTWRIAVPAMACMVLLVSVISTGLYQNWYAEDNLLTAQVKNQETQNPTSPQPKGTEQEPLKTEVTTKDEVGGVVAPQKSVEKGKQTQKPKETTGGKPLPTKPDAKTVQQAVATEKPVTTEVASPDTKTEQATIETEGLSKGRALEEADASSGGATNDGSVPMAASLQIEDETEDIYQVEVPDTEKYLNEYETKTGVDLRENMVKDDPPTFRMTEDAGKELLDYSRQEGMKTHQIQDGSGSDMLVIFVE